MTGGSLPAMTWQRIMADAHQGIELKPLPGLPPAKEKREPAVALADRKDNPIPQRPPSWVLSDIGRLTFRLVVRWQRSLAAGDKRSSPLAGRYRGCSQLGRKE